MFKNFKWTRDSQARNSLTTTYEPIQPFLFIAFSEIIECQYVFDIGANIGAYSLIATLLPSIAEIHAFEAEDIAYETLVRNIDLNNASSKIIPHLKAVSSSSGTLKFAISGPMAGINAVSDTSIHSPDLYSRTRIIECSAMDDMFAIEGHPVSLKIDVEGHETDVLNGARKLLERNKCVVQIETYNNQDILTSFFQGIGYQKIFSALHDLYFSNHHAWDDDSNIIKAVETACAEMIKHNLQKS